MTTASIRDAVAAALKEHKPSGPVCYKTAGLRCPASNLTGVAFRFGVLAAVRSLDRGQFVGVMVTASHNPSCDNGIKLIDPDGGMLKTAWEPLIAEFMECSESDGSHWIAGHMRDPESRFDSLN
ncbi:unnamed protein product [Echinostoma caproni]|uniref:PGM_PMM_I domain-containing protein n=1 Tax=Echinostoma caproni TaxID=27848 RepID=A0A183BDB8_9TREM|nr:unnamed protein product [Echinostoma caproni]